MIKETPSSDVLNMTYSFRRLHKCNIAFGLFRWTDFAVQAQQCIPLYYWRTYVDVNIFF